MLERCVAHLDMDAFYVSVELRRRPELRGLPVIVAGSGPRAVVTTASYEARRYGVHSAMPASRARRLCPEAVVMEPDFRCYREASREVMAILRDHVEIVEVVGLDEAYLELTGLPAPRASMRLIREQVRLKTALGCSVGVGPNKLVAKVASDAEKPGGFVVLTREQACQRFACAPCGLLPGIGPKTGERLRRRGIETIAQLAATELEVLSGSFGPRQGLELARRARFEDDTPVSEERKVRSESREATFDRDLSDRQELEAQLRRLAAQLAEALVAQRRQGRTVGIKVRLDDFSTHTRARTLRGPVRSPQEITAVALELLERFAPKRPVRLLGVRVAGLEQHQGEGVAQLTLGC
jgi:DNA polymerase-4